MAEWLIDEVIDDEDEIVVRVSRYGDLWSAYVDGIEIDGVGRSPSLALTQFVKSVAERKLQHDNNSLDADDYAACSTEYCDDEYAFIAKMLTPTGDYDA